jgi:hypothetical protein
MNLEPPREFDPGEALGGFDTECESYGLSRKAYLFAILTCRAVEGFATPSFTIDLVYAGKLQPSGCFIEFVIKTTAFGLDVGLEKMRLWMSLADEGEGARRLCHVGQGEDPEAWQSLLATIGRIEHFRVLINHAATLRRMWSEWLLEQKRRGDERGW